MNAETQRLNEARAGKLAWKHWGPYLSERQWGTVREDYSEYGNAWEYFSHDQARSRAYAWGEDGLAGISDDKQLLCFALALWNGQDAILKERLFGLTNNEGNHGEDVKEYYYYLDSTPTHSYMHYLYKYPQRAFPYSDLVKTNHERSRQEPEYELIDTGIFDDDRYFDIFVTYAKASPTDMLIQIDVANRGPETATLHLLPTLWFRNIWSWAEQEQPQPELRWAGNDAPAVVATHPDLGVYSLYLEQPAPLLFTENESNSERLYGRPNRTRYVKDGFHDYLINGKEWAINPERRGTKAAVDYELTVEPGETRTIRLRLKETPVASPSPKSAGQLFGKPFDETLATCKGEADAFYDSVIPPSLNDDQRLVTRQALAGMLWSKQYYDYNVRDWLYEKRSDPNASPPKRSNLRNREWFHLINGDIISMPDKWEYPWYAAWDLAFHCIALQMVDPDFAKTQLELMLNPNYLHPSGQLPAYEWNFSDVNPPVHAWAAYYMYNTEEVETGKGDIVFLKRCFNKLLMNFTWWVNRKDRSGSNIFDGGFLGLDNIGVFDRSAPLPTGGYLEQADGTAWMAFYAQVMMQIALELSRHDPTYEDMAIKFFDHFLQIVSAMDRIGENSDELWDEEDGFFYDVLRLPDGRSMRLKLRSIVGLLSVAASSVVEQEQLDAAPNLVARARYLDSKRPDLTSRMPTLSTPGVNGRRLLAVLSREKLQRVLGRMLDEGEFLAPFGIRALSRAHQENPYTFEVGGHTYGVGYEPAESATGLFGGNSNWRGPIWFPVNIVIIRGLLVLHQYYGDSFTVECPTGSGQQMTLVQVAEELSRRLSSIFLRNAEGRRPLFGGVERFQNDPHWRDYLLFYEYFHGDNGAGIGASHQTGWTGLIAPMLRLASPEYRALAATPVPAKDMPKDEDRDEPKDEPKDKDIDSDKAKNDNTAKVAG